MKLRPGFKVALSTVSYNQTRVVTWMKLEEASALCGTLMCCDFAQASGSKNAQRHEVLELTDFGKKMQKERVGSS